MVSHVFVVLKTIKKGFNIFLQFIIVFNTLSNVKYDVISFFVERSQHQKICIEDPKGKKLHYQACT